MRAVCIHSFGGPERLHPDNLPKPRPEPGEVLVRVVASGVNAVDWKIREGLLKDALPHAFPLIPGWEAAGLVEDLGTGATRFRRGDRVWAYARKPVVQGGTYAEYVTVPEAGLGKMPPGILYEEAAAIPVAGLTAMQALFSAGGLTSGETVLVVGGSGGVGHMAVQLARGAGATVIASAGPHNQAFLSEGGAHHPVDYSREDVVDAVRRYRAGGVDLAIDCVGGAAGRRGLDAVREGGRFVSIVDRPDEAAAASRGIRSAFREVQPDPEGLDRLAALVEGGRLDVYVAKIFQLGEAAEAQARSQEGRVRGKLVLAL